MSQTFTQPFLKPGRYHMGGGKFATLTKEDIASYVDGTKRMIAAGYAPPVIFEHAEPGSAEGSPRDAKAERVKHGAGWLTDLTMGDDGAAVHTLDIRSKVAANGLKNGSIKYTSPELRESWTDGKGVVHKHVIAHVALTHKPRNIEQGKLEPVATPPVAQFSLEDLQFAADDDDEQSKSAPGDIPSDTPAEKPPENPDLGDGAPTEDEQQLEAAVALLSECCQLALPADTTIKTLVRDLLTALKTKQAIEAAKTTEEADDDDEEEEAAPIEERSVLQYSIDEVEAGIEGHPLLVRVLKQEHAAISGRLEAMIGESKITPAMRDQLLRRNVKQFSSEGDELPTFKLSEVAAILDDCCYPGMAFSTESVFATGKEHEPPTVDQPGEMTTAQADKLIAELSTRHPHLARS